jgi:hypothetical protein
MSELLVKNSLFWRYNGEIKSSWYLCGDEGTPAMREAHLQWCIKEKCDTVVLNMNNEEMMSLFRNGYMRDLDIPKCEVFMQYVRKIALSGGNVVPVFFDGPAIPGAKYHPIVESWHLHEAFIAATCAALNPYVRAYIIGCETNRYFSVEQVEELVRVTKKYCGLLPVGTHEQSVGQKNGQWVLHRRIPSNLDFFGYETSNHPADGDQRTPDDMVEEVRFLVSQCQGKPVWVMEHNLNADGAISRAQARAMAAIPGVYGIGGPM